MYPPFLKILLDCECKHFFDERPAFHLFHFNALNISIIHGVYGYICLNQTSYMESNGCVNS